MGPRPFERGIREHEPWEGYSTAGRKGLAHHYPGYHYYIIVCGFLGETSKLERLNVELRSSSWSRPGRMRVKLTESSRPCADRMVVRQRHLAGAAFSKSRCSSLLDPRAEPGTVDG